MKHNLQQPCKDCPFRRSSMAGWLGSGDPDHFIDAALADEFGGENPAATYAEPCHLTVDYSDPEWRECADEQEACVGAAIFYRNVDRFKMPRERRRFEMVRDVQPDHEKVFSTAEEFVEHHATGTTMRSWEWPP